VAYYVPLGSRGLLLRVGTSLIDVLHGVIYWHSSQRRKMAMPLFSAEVVLPDPLVSGLEAV
jgi:hypothetical protein